MSNCQMEVRCPGCGKLLFRAAEKRGHIEIQCTRCRILLSWPRSANGMVAETITANGSGGYANGRKFRR